jgi:ubiquinol-cytochrome c reductase iron-sulfur subunit
VDRTPGDVVHQKRAERRAVAAFLLCAASSVGLAVVYLRGGEPQLEGLLLGLALGGLGFGFVTWGNHLLPQGPVVEQRHELPSGPAERERLESDLERGGVVARRRLLLRALGLALAGLGAAALFPIRSLGPKPGDALTDTPWRRGRRLVTEDGALVRADDVPLEGLVTVFPEGHADAADAQAVLIRVLPGLIVAREGREDWSPRGFVAYSKLCTHAGCPVGLYTAETHQLLCPCHQSTFDVLRHARPVFGPAAAPLPQLPIVIDREGYLVANGEFSEPAGPLFWRKQ